MSISLLISSSSSSSSCPKYNHRPLITILCQFHRISQVKSMWCCRSTALWLTISAPYILYQTLACFFFRTHGPCQQLRPMICCHFALSFANYTASMQWAVTSITVHNVRSPSTCKSTFTSSIELGLHLSSVVVLEESPCPWGSSRTNLQVLVLVLGAQSSRKLSRT